MSNVLPIMEFKKHTGSANVRLIYCYEFICVVERWEGVSRLRGADIYREQVSGGHLSGADVVGMSYLHTCFQSCGNVR